jgi:hypothetical protein
MGLFTFKDSKMKGKKATNKTRGGAKNSNSNEGGGKIEEVINDFKSQGEPFFIVLAEEFKEDGYRILNAKLKRLEDKYKGVKNLNYDLVYLWYQFAFFSLMYDRSREIKQHNTWLHFGDAINLGYELKSATLLLQKGDKLEKIKIEFIDDGGSLHYNIREAIFNAYNAIKPGLKNKKIENLQKPEVFAIKLMNQSIEEGVPSRITELKNILGSKEAVYNYLESVIREVVPQSTFIKLGLKDINKFLRNHLTKF